MSHALHVNAPEGTSTIEYTREFDHPVEAVFRAHKEVDLISQWMGPRRYQAKFEEYDCRSGGAYRFIHSDPDSGEEYSFRGSFHTVRDNELVIQTFEFEGFPDVVSLEWLQFERTESGGTRLVGTSVYPSIESRDGMVQSGMESGMSEGYERLEELLAGEQ